MDKIGENINVKPEFKNRENKEYKTEDGPIWNSRSVAILGIIFFTIDDKTYVLAEKRSKKMDAPGLWCVPCGYIDWDETGIQGLHREIYEETGLFLPDLKSTLIYKDLNPFYVHTEPGENRQNITLAYSSSYMLNHEESHTIEKSKKIDIIRKKIFEIENFKSEEVNMIKLIRIDHIEKYSWAFNHEKRIFQAMDHVSYKLSEPEIIKLAAFKASELKEIAEIKEAREEFAAFSFWKKLKITLGL